MWFEQFHSMPPLRAIDAVTAMGAQPVLTWEPWRWDRRPAPTMVMLHSGIYDDHLRRWARGLAGVATTVDVRFGHEFNGYWYPWSTAGGTSAADYIGVWRRIHRIFQQEGATNVRWVWSPTAGLPGGPPLEAWFPGPAYVDVVGVDGYNWGTSQVWSSWVQPAELFAQILDEVHAITGDMPVTISEVGCAEAGGDKAEWIRSLVTYLCEQTDVDGLTWFEHDKETDWRTTSSARSAAAMAAALSAAQRSPCSRAC